MSTTSSTDKASASSGVASTSTPAPHAHSHGKCPVTGASSVPSGAGNAYPFCPPQEGDVRSVCPALNTMANHGYIRRDGRSLSSSDVSTGLRKCYGLSIPLSSFLAHVGFLLLHKVPFIQRITLHDISYHNRVEHDASLVHRDTPEGETYAPQEIDMALVDKFFREDVRGDGEQRVNAEDVGRSRVRRERDCRPIGSIKQEIARGEMAIILGVWSSVHFKKPAASTSTSTTGTNTGTTTTEKVGAPAEWIRQWLSEERLPEVEVASEDAGEGEKGEARRKVQWTPTRVHGFGEVVKMSKAIRAVADGIRKAEAEEAAKKTGGEAKK